MANQFGKAGEDYTTQWLENQGFRTIARNYHSRYGEIDIIAENDEYIVFVEVKTRQDGAMVSALEAVTREKQRKILLTAQTFLSERPSALQPRFDVSAVTVVRGEIFGLQYFPNAFGI